MSTTLTPDRLRVIGLEAANVKRLVAVDVNLTPGLNVVSGRNGAGKTSTLDALFYALGGAKAQAKAPQVIRDGEKKASVTVTIGRGVDAIELVATRTWKGAGNGTLTVTNADGAKYPKAQQVLDDLVGRLSFDPLAFAEAPAKTQLEQLLELVELPFDPAALDAQRQALYAERADVNREVKRLAAAVDGLPPVPADTPDLEVSVADLAAEHADAVATIAAAQQASRRLATCEADVIRLVAELAAAETALTAAQDDAGNFVDLPNVDAIAARMRDADSINQAVRAKHAKTTTTAALGEAEAEAATLTERIQKLDARKAEALAAATMPIDGLGFDDDGVTYQGVPFTQCSGAERLRVSLAMAIAANPTLGLCRITDGSLLDPEGMALVAEMCDANGFQVVMERVAGSGGPTGIVIEEGLVASTPTAAPAASNPTPAADPFGWLNQEGGAA